VELLARVGVDAAVGVRAEEVAQALGERRGQGRSVRSAS
jgi:hypothetical protein